MLENVSQLVEMQAPSLGADDQLLLVHPPADEGLVLLVRRYPGQVSVMSWEANVHDRATSAVGLEHMHTAIEGEDFQRVPALYTHVILYMTKAKERLDLTLALLHDVLAKAQSVVLVGEKRSGVESAAKRLFKDRGWGVRKDLSARHSQWWQVSPKVHEKPAELSRFEQHFQFPMGTSSSGPDASPLKISTLPGVFSHGELDAGTQLLLSVLQEACEQPPQQILSILRRKGPAARALDFGCGSGVISLSLARLAPAMKIDALDIDALALLATRRNCSLNQIPAGQIQTLLNDGLAGHTGRYSLIISNPPFHQGQKQDLSVTRQFLRDCQQHLSPTGELLIVANRFLPYAECLEDAFRRWSILRENSRFRVYHAQM